MMALAIGTVAGVLGYWFWFGGSFSTDAQLRKPAGGHRRGISLASGSRASSGSTVARVCHLLAKEAAYVPNHHHIADFRKARELENLNRKQAP